MEHIFLDEPLALEYLGADLASDYEVKILDMRLDTNLPRCMSSFQPSVVGVTGYTVHVPTVKVICQQVKQTNPEVLTIVGGHHATVAPEDFALPYIDIVVIGDGVPTLKEIIQKLEKGEDFREIRGVAFTENGKLCRAEPRPITELDNFPLPDRSLTKNYRKHYHSEWAESLALVRTSRGCPHHCSFCGLWKLTGRRYLTRSVESIVEELAQIEEDYVFFADDESFIDTNRMSNLAKAIRAAGIEKKYSTVIRSDTLVKNPQLLAEWKKIGLDGLAVGLEFFSQEDLNYIDKGTSPAENMQAIDLLRSLDIPLYPLLIIRPEFSELDFRNLARQARLSNFDRLIQYSVLTPLPGTDLYEQEKEQMLKVDFEYFDYVHTILPTRLSLKEFYKQLAWLHKNSLSLKTYFNYLRKFSFPQRFRVAWAHYRFLSRVKTLYKDYPT